MNQGILLCAVGTSLLPDKMTGERENGVTYLSNVGKQKDVAVITKLCLYNMISGSNIME